MQLCRAGSNPSARRALLLRTEPLGRSRGRSWGPVAALREFRPTFPANGHEPPSSEDVLELRRVRAFDEMPGPVAECSVPGRRVAEERRHEERNRIHGNN